MNIYLWSEHVDSEHVRYEQIDFEHVWCGVYMLIMNMNVVSIVQSLKKVINHSFLHSSRNSLRAAHVFLPL